MGDARQRLRAAGRRARATLATATRREAAVAVAARVVALPEVTTARTVLLTSAVGDELDLDALAGLLRARGVRVALPRVEGDDLVAVAVAPDDELRPGWQGVAEPTGPPLPTRPDVVVVPALVLDRHGNRLGYGGGHFDRYLAGPGAGATTVGAVFHAQLVDRVPVAPHDVQLDVVVTERGTWREGRPVAHVGVSDDH